MRYPDTTSSEPRDNPPKVPQPKRAIIEHASTTDRRDGYEPAHGFSDSPANRARPCQQKRRPGPRSVQRLLEAARQAHNVVTKSTDVITSGAREINEKAVGIPKPTSRRTLISHSVSFTQRTSKRPSTFRASLRASRWKHSRIRLRNSPALWRNRRRRPLPRASTNNAVVSPPVADLVLVQRRFRRGRNQAC